MGATGVLRRRVALLTALAAAFAVLAPGAASAERTIGLSADVYQFKVPPGRTGAGEVVVINDGDEDIKAFVYAADQEIDAKGNVTYVVPNRDDPQFMSSPSSWVRLKTPDSAKALGNTPYLDMTPKQRVPVKFDFQVPAAAAPGDYNVMLFFEMFDVAPGGTGATSRVTGRVGTRLRIRVVGEVVERIEVAPFSAKGFVMADSVPYVFRVTNGGNVDKYVAARLDLLSGDEEVVGTSQAATEAVVYAGQNLELSGRLLADRTLLGKYTLRLTTTYAKEGAAATSTVPAEIVKERTVWAAPLWLAIALILFFGGIAIWLAWRSAVRAAARKSAREGGDGHGHQSRDRDRARARSREWRDEPAPVGEEPVLGEPPAAPVPAPVPAPTEHVRPEPVIDDWSDGEDIDFDVSPKG